MHASRLEGRGPCLYIYVSDLGPIADQQPAVPAAEHGRPRIRRHAQVQRVMHVKQLALGAVSEVVQPDAT